MSENQSTPGTSQESQFLEEVADSDILVEVVSAGPADNILLPNQSPPPDSQLPNMDNFPASHVQIASTGAVMRHPTPPPNNPILDPIPDSHIQMASTNVATHQTSDVNTPGVDNQTTGRVSSALPSSATALHPKRRRLNVGVSDHVREMKAKEYELELKRLEVALLQAQNESRRITLEEDRNRRENVKLDNFMREQREKFDNFMREQRERDTKMIELLQALITRAIHSQGAFILKLQ